MKFAFKKEGVEAGTIETKSSSYYCCCFIIIIVIKREGTVGVEGMKNFVGVFVDAIICPFINIILYYYFTGFFDIDRVIRDMIIDDVHSISNSIGESLIIERTRMEMLKFVEEDERGMG